MTETAAIRAAVSVVIDPADEPLLGSADIQSLADLGQQLHHVMDPAIVGLVVSACTFGGALGGHWLSTILPEHHLNEASKKTMNLGIGLVATMTALVLGLVTASAKSSFDAMDSAVKQTATEILTLDRLLARYGPETDRIREAVQRVVASRIETTWPRHSSRPADLDPIRSGTASVAEGLADGIRSLTPRDDSQRSLQARALDLSESILADRWGLFAVDTTSVSLLFLVVLLFWLTITFASFGLVAPRNATVFTVLVVCALSVGSAVFLILEMDGPFDGLLRVSADPLRYAHTRLNQ